MLTVTAVVFVSHYANWSHDWRPAFTHRRLDYCNAVLAETADDHVQNTVACLHRPKCHAARPYHADAAQYRLQWVKTAVFARKCIHGVVPCIHCRKCLLLSTTAVSDFDDDRQLATQYPNRKYLYLWKYDRYRRNRNGKPGFCNYRGAR